MKETNKEIIKRIEKVKSISEENAELKRHRALCIEKIERSIFVFSACLDYLKGDDSAQAKYLWEMIQKYLYDRD